MSLTCSPKNFTKGNTPKKLELWANIFLYSSPIVGIAIATAPFGDPLLLSWIAGIWNAVVIAFKGISKIFGINTEAI